MKILSSLVIGCIVSLIAFPAFAGVDVDPSDLSPELFVRVEREQSPTSSPQAPTTANPVASKKPTFDPIVSCRTDASLGIYGCKNVEPGPEAEADGPEVTPGDILRAVREIGLPSLRLEVQPGAETLVNVDTLLHQLP